jgi:adenosylcobinamide kinase/adenosylcobinamide-phosphate guanylyltransferase
MLAANALESRCVIDGDSVEALVLERVKALLGAARKSSGSLIVVTNEVGSSIHPPTNLGRWFQDGLGRANQAVAREADAVHLLVCGVPVAIKGSLA